MHAAILKKLLRNFKSDQFELKECIFSTLRLETSPFLFRVKAVKEL